MTPKAATKCVDERIKQLRELRDANVKACFLWSAATLGEMLVILNPATSEYQQGFSQRWIENSPDQVWVEREYPEPSPDDYYEVEYEPEPDGWWSPQGKAQVLLGTTEWNGKLCPHERYRWMSVCLDLMLEALRVASQAAAMKGAKFNPNLPRGATSPPFQKITAGGAEPEMVSKVMRTRWEAAEDLLELGKHSEACILYGSLFEAVLVAYVEQTAGTDVKQSYGKGKPVGRWSKNDLFEVAEQITGLDSIVRSLQGSIVDYRNLIHVHSDEGMKGLHWQARKPEAAIILKNALQLLFGRFEESLEIPKGHK